MESDYQESEPDNVSNKVLYIKFSFLEIHFQ